jgi:hypothetical protein
MSADRAHTIAQTPAIVLAALVLRIERRAADRGAHAANRSHRDFYGQHPQRHEWNLPAFESRGATMRHLLGGWQVNASTFLRSGLTANMPGSVDLIGDPVLANPTTARWFNTCTLTAAGARQNCASDNEQPAFRIRAENALNTTGSRLENVYRSDPWILDLSFFKTVRLSQRFNFQTRVEMFNVTNAVQWPAPNTTVTSANFGTVAETQANDPRFVQVAFRLIF